MITGYEKKAILLDKYLQTFAPTNKQVTLLLKNQSIFNIHNALQ